MFEASGGDRFSFLLENRDRQLHHRHEFGPLRAEPIALLVGSGSQVALRNAYDIALKCAIHC